MSIPRRQNWAKIALSVFFVAAFVLLLLPFYTEILLGGIFALAIEPVLGRVLQAKHLRWKASVAGILAGMFLLIAAPLSLVAYKTYFYFYEISKLGVQNTELFKKAVIFRSQLLLFINNTLETLNLENKVDLAGISEDALSKMGNLLVGLSTGFIYRAPSVLLSTFVFTVALYFFLAEASLLRRTFDRWQLLSHKEFGRLIGVLQKSSFNTVVTSLAMGALQATVVSVGALILGTGDFTMVFVITFFCSFIPLVGAGPVALSLGLYNLVMGTTGSALGFVVVAVVAGFVDNALRPFLISSGQEDIHPVVSLLVLVGGLMIFGMPGLFLAPVITSLAFNVIPIFFPTLLSVDDKRPKV